MKKLKRGQLRFIDTEAGVIEFEHRLMRSQVKFVGFDTEYDPGKPLRDKKAAENIRNRRPLLMSLCMVTSGLGEERDLLAGQGYVFDLRKPDVTRRLKFLNKLSMKVVGHFLETDIIT